MKRWDLELTFNSSSLWTTTFSVFESYYTHI